MNQKTKTIEKDFTPIQLRIPVEIEKIVSITDEVYTFNEVIDHIDLRKYCVKEENIKGRPQYDREKLLKVIIFAYMEDGYASVREIEKKCQTDIRYIWMLDGQKGPTFMTIENCMNEIKEGITGILNEINGYIFKKEKVDTRHLYIDGTKIEANANKYTWVWKRSCTRSRDKVFRYVEELIKEINLNILNQQGLQIETREIYTIEYLEEIVENYVKATGIEEQNIVRGKGHHRTIEERYYLKLLEYISKLKRYSESIEICGESRNSYSKTDKDATFMRVKSDYMGNDQLLPAYNMQIGVCDEYVAVVDAKQYASDMECFIPLIEKFKETYGKYPKYPVADAGYGSYNNYLYCEEKGMEKYMKYTMYNKESTDPKYRENAFRSVNFETDSQGKIKCPGGKTFNFSCTKHIRGNEYGRTEEIYECENCEGCKYREKCFNGKGNRKISLNRELSKIHKEVYDNMQSANGYLLCMNRSIQAEGVFGNIKWNRQYKRAYRRSLKSIIFEFTLISCGFNLYKYHNKRIQQLQKAA